MKIKKLLTSVSIAALILFSCSHFQSKHVQIDPDGKPEISFDTTFFDLGSVNEGKKVTCTYIVRNTGTGTLVINDVVPTCGCTVAEYEKQPLRNGESGKIKLVFNTKKRSGSVTKTASVKSNAINGTKTLTFRVNIIKNQ